MARVLVTGGAGYVGSALVPKLLDAGHEIVVYDLMLFGANGFPASARLELVRADIRDTQLLEARLKGVDAVIHLACISNDPSYELNPELGKAINYDCFEPMVHAAKRAGVRRFIYASSSSVYGVSDEPNVTEEHPLVPLTDYSRYKGLCEEILLRHGAPDFEPIVLRPATVCGYSTRMRFDLVANIFANQAIHERRVRILGGAQKRPMIHMDDITELYVRLLSEPADRVAGEIFNVAERNYAVEELANLARDVVQQEMPEEGDVRVERVPTNDPRSYHVSAQKIRERLGFRPRRTIEDGIRDICRAAKEGRFPNALGDDRYYNVCLIQKLGLK